MPRTAVVLFALALGCATAGVPPGNPERGYVVWGYVGQGPQTPATGQMVSIVDANGVVIRQATTDAFGKYTLAYQPPGSYTLQVGTVQMPVLIASTDQRLDIDLQNPQGVMNYATAPPEPQSAQATQAQGGGASTGGSDPSLGSLPDPDAPVPGSDCWAAAGCEGYDSSTNTYEYEPPSSGGSYE